MLRFGVGTLGKIAWALVVRLATAGKFAILPSAREPERSAVNFFPMSGMGAFTEACKCPPPLP